MAGKVKGIDYTASMFIKTVSQTLQNHGVAFAVVGGYAVALHGAQIPLLEKQDLICMKARSARPQDLADIEALRKLP